MTFAAPLAEEEEVNAQQMFQEIESLLKSADPVENDISQNVEATESTAEVPSPSSLTQDVVDEVEKEQVQAATDVQVTPTTASLAEDVPSDEPTKDQEFTDTVDAIFQKYGEEKEDTPQASETGEETVEKVEEISANTTKPADVKTTTEKEELLIPVTEVIPPPKVAFVLGEYADEEVFREPAHESNDEYKIVLGETEDGIPFLSEYQPDIFPNDHEEVNADAPLVEQINHEYPQEAIMPGAEFRPFQGPMTDHSDDMYDDYNPEPSSGPNMDFVSDYDSPSFDYGVNDDYFGGMDSPSMHSQMPEYPTESHFDGRLDYGDDFQSMPYDESHDYDAGASITEDDHMMNNDHMMNDDYGMNNDDMMKNDHMIEDDHNMNDDMAHDQKMPDQTHSMSELPIHDDLKASMAAELENLSDAIVAGLHENYQPEPILGMIPFPTEFSEDSSSTSDDSIRPSAMANFDSPAVENTRHEDDMMETPMPEIPSMVDLPRPVAEFPVNNPPMASMQPLDVDDMSFMDDNGMDGNDDNTNEYELAELAGRPTQPINEDETSTNDFDTDSQPDVVIELDIDNQQAMVNGKPFAWERPTSILGFIGQILEATRMRSRFPQRNEYSPEPKPYYYYYDDGMNFPERNQYASSYMYPSSYNDEPQSEQYQPSSFDYDYLPYNPFLSAVRRRLLEERFKKMRSFDNGYGYDYLSGYSPMQGYSSLSGYDNSMSEYNPMQGYNSINSYDDSMSGYNPMHEYGPMQGNGQNGRSFDYYQGW